MGDALLQKTYTVDFMTKKRVINKGIVPQYYVEDDHEPIIPKELFYRVQEEIMRRAALCKSAETRDKKQEKEKQVFLQVCPDRHCHLWEMRTRIPSGDMGKESEEKDCMEMQQPAYKWQRELR